MGVSVIIQAAEPNKGNFLSPCCGCLVENCHCNATWYKPKQLGLCRACGCECGIWFSKKLNRVLLCKPCGCKCGMCESREGTLNCCTCTGKKTCFPSSARVSLENGKTVRMSELQIGDRVQTGIAVTLLLYLQYFCFTTF